MAAETQAPILSVVICTYNRPDLVAQVLETIAHQDAPPASYEVLVIDNASPRDIASVVQSYDGRIPGLRCIREERVGLSHARNRGWREARGDYVAYVDDDCQLPPEWVGVALGIVRHVTPIMFGGPYRAFYMTPKPTWFKDDYGSAKFGDGPGVLRSDRALSGCNMVIRKDALQALGGFDPALGMTGMTMAYGEETALQKGVRDRYGPDCIYYDPDLWVYHLVRPEKMNLRWIMRRRYLGGLYGYRCSPRERAPSGRLSLMLRSARIAAGFGLDVIRGSLARDRSRYPYIANYIWEHASYRLERLGQVRGQLETCGR